MTTNIEAFDRKISHLIGRLPRRLHKPFDILGHMTLPSIWAIAIFAYAVITYDGLLITPATITLVFVPLATLSKFLFARRRPPTMYADTLRIKSYSFPSSHAYAAALGSSFFTIALWSVTAGLISIPLTLLAITIGVSRVHLGAHYPSDVCAGWLLGIIMSASIAILV